MVFRLVLSTWCPPSMLIHGIVETQMETTQGDHKSLNAAIVKRIVVPRICICSRCGAISPLKEKPLVVTERGRYVRCKRDFVCGKCGFHKSTYCEVCRSAHFHLLHKLFPQLHPQ